MNNLRKGSPSSCRSLSPEQQSFWLNYHSPKMWHLAVFAHAAFTAAVSFNHEAEPWGVIKQGEFIGQSSDY
jgi:hypothetical protein